MRILLDTHAFLWWILDSPRLSEHARTLVADGATELVLSAASSWEIAIKTALGRIELPGNPSAFVTEQMLGQRISGLPVQHAHALRVAELPLHHRDPFDRLLVAQAQLERLPLMTADPAIRRYDVETTW